MKIFKKIPIEGYEDYEVNEDGYVLHTKSGHLQKLEYSFMMSSNKGEMLSLLHIIKYTFNK